jgi:hypothetical protein
MVLGDDMLLGIELNTPVGLKLVTLCHLGPGSCKHEILHHELVNLCRLGPWPLPDALLPTWPCHRGAD